MDADVLNFAYPHLEEILCEFSLRYRFGIDLDPLTYVQKVRRGIHSYLLWNSVGGMIEREDRVDECTSCSFAFRPSNVYNVEDIQFPSSMTSS